MEATPDRKTGDYPFSAWPGDITDTPVIEAVVDRWKGEIFQVKYSRVKVKQ